MNAKVVLGGLALGESPQWRDGRLWVADWAAHELIALDVTGTGQDAERPDSIPCCIDRLSDGSKHCVRVREDGQVLAVEVTVPSARSATAGR